MSDTPLILTGEQADAVELMLRSESQGGALIASDVGTGKTVIGVEYLLASEAETVLIVAPLATHDSWEETLLRQGWEFPIHVLDSTAKGKKAFENYKWMTPGVYLIGPELFERRAWSRAPIKGREGATRKVDSKVWSLPVDAMIYDEVHMASNVQSWSHKALMNTRPKFRIGMSGTYEGGNFDGAYAVTKWVWPHLAEKNIYDWRHKWAETVYDHFAVRNEKTVGEKEPGAFVASLPCYVRIESDLPQPNMIDVIYDLHPEQRRVLDELDARMIAWIDDNPLITKLSITQRTRMRQATLAMPTLRFDMAGELAEVTFDEDAISAGYDQMVYDIRNGKVTKPALILTTSTKFANIVTARLNQDFGRATALEWSGNVKKKDRPAVKAAFMNREIDFIVGQPAAMGTGTDGLHLVSHTLVRLGLSDRRIINDQGIGRLNRKNQPVLPITVITYLANGTIDSGHMNKQITETLAARKRMRRNNG